MNTLSFAFQEALLKESSFINYYAQSFSKEVFLDCSARDGKIFLSHNLSTFAPERAQMEAFLHEVYASFSALISFDASFEPYKAYEIVVGLYVFSGHMDFQVATFSPSEQITWYM